MTGIGDVNITCPRCRHRHPASRSCEEAKRLADGAIARRAVQATLDRTAGRELLTELVVDQIDIDIALEQAQAIEDDGFQTAAACIRACVRAAQEKTNGRLAGCGNWKPKHGVGPYCGNCGFHADQHHQR